MFKRKTRFAVMIEGNQVPVMQAENGRLYATVKEPDGNGYREWHAMDLETLNNRIQDTTNKA